MDDDFLIRMPPDIRSVAIGDHQALIIDNFLDNPQAMVEFAARSQFEPYPKFDSKMGYPGIRAPAPAKYSNHVRSLLDSVIRANFGVPDELELRKSICAFSLTTMPPGELGPLQRTPHFDASTPYHFAILLYLCEERHGGTGFYRHNATGLQQITAEKREQYLDVYYQEINAIHPALRYFDHSNAHFSFLGMIPAKFNRLVVYRGSLLHTACINPSISIGTNPRSGRLTVNTFFDF
jgi:hypothetical protein